MKHADVIRLFKILLVSNSILAVLIIIAFAMFFLREFIQYRKYRNSPEGAWIKNKH